MREEAQSTNPSPMPLLVLGLTLPGEPSHDPRTWIEEKKAQREG